MGSTLTLAIVFKTPKFQPWVQNRTQMVFIPKKKDIPITRQANDKLQSNSRNIVSQSVRPLSHSSCSSSRALVTCLNLVQVSTCIRRL